MISFPLSISACTFILFLFVRLVNASSLILSSSSFVIVFSVVAVCTVMIPKHLIDDLMISFSVVNNRVGVRISVVNSVSEPLMVAVVVVDEAPSVLVVTSVILVGVPVLRLFVK